MEYRFTANRSHHGDPRDEKKYKFRHAIITVYGTDVLISSVVVIIFSCPNGHVKSNSGCLLYFIS